MKEKCVKKLFIERNENEKKINRNLREGIIISIIKADENDKKFEENKMEIVYIDKYL
jgi:hypothetical protein